LVRAVVAVVAQVEAEPPVDLGEVVEAVEARARLAHKLLPLVPLQVVRLPVAVAPRRVPQPEAVVAAPLLVQGLVASESLRRR
jgi:hypothetical protein